MKALDLSYAIPPASWWRDRYAEGYRRAIADAWTGTHVPGDPAISLNRARAAGLGVEAYTVVNLHPGTYTVDKAREACGSAWPHVETLWLDLEVKGIPASTLIQHTREGLARARALGKRTGIYTGRWFWAAYMGNTKAFAGEWLWNAHYDRNADIDYWATPYGGFTRLAIEQYQGTTNVGGQSVDLNTVTAEYVKEVSAMTEAKDILVRQPVDYAAKLAAGKWPNEFGPKSWAEANVEDCLWYLVFMFERRDDRLDILFGLNNPCNFGDDKMTMGQRMGQYRRAIHGLLAEGSAHAQEIAALKSLVGTQETALQGYSTAIEGLEERMQAIEFAGGVPEHPHEFEVIARTPGG